MSKLIKLMQCLEKKRNQSINNYSIPDLWNVWGYRGNELIKKATGELKVNPYRFYYEVIHSYILPQMENEVEYHKPIHQFKNKPQSSDIFGGDWIKQSVVYSMMIRTSTSWDHDLSGDLETHNKLGLKDTGTFVKTIALLPLLKQMGIDTVYMLPISKFSLKDKKGELGSPYGVSNFYELDPNLKDPITGDELTIDEEFQAFVEACHILDMKVMIDIIPRTNAIENDLIIDHPEWFYWIKSDEFTNYFPPHVPNLGNTVNPTPEHLEVVYKSEEVWKHIRKFSYDPKTIDKEKYERVVLEYKQNKDVSFSNLIKREFNIQVAPAFSDQINDPQPPWTDITFFKMYEDHPTLSQVELNKYLNADEHLPPYILFDTIKNNFYQGKKPNEELWNTLSGVIPYYQKNFGIDGARIDMGHALSKELLDRIIKKAREIDPNFCFIAEELYTGNAERARSLGYNMIIGDGFWHEPRFKERRLHEFMKSTYKLAAPIFACGETHDTPRLAAREGGRVLSKMLTILNMFVPNAVPFINSGQEIYETQPMNTGLDARPDEQYQLPENDPFYGKLALFDKYAFHYINEGRWDLPNTLIKVSNIRKEYGSIITNLDRYITIELENQEFIAFAYRIDDEQMLLVLSNTNPFESVNCDISRLTLNKSIIKELYSFEEQLNEIRLSNHQNVSLSFQPGEVKILKLL